MRWPARAAEALPEGAFAVVMATAIVSRACHDELPAVSAALLGIATAALVVVAALLAVRPRGAATRAGWWDAVTLVAAVAAIASGLAARGHGDAARVLDVAAIAAWLLAMARPAPWTRTGRRTPGDQASGRRLLVLVATQSAVVAAAALDRSAGSSLLAGAVVAAWAAALVLHVPVAAPIARGLFDRGRRGRFRADDWILMGVLAISALAASALLDTPGIPAREGVRVLGIAAWVGACLWIPVLARIDLAGALGSRPGVPGSLRWSMVFPFGMFAAASQALGSAAGLSLVHRVGLEAAWAALIAWIAVAVGIAAGAMGGRVRATPAGSPRLDRRQLPE